MAGENSHTAGEKFSVPPVQLPADRPAMAIKGTLKLIVKRPEDRFVCLESRIGGTNLGPMSWYLPCHLKCQCAISDGAKNSSEVADVETSKGHPSRYIELNRAGLYEENNTSPRCRICKLHCARYINPCILLYFHCCRCRLGIGLCYVGVQHFAEKPVVPLGQCPFVEKVGTISRVCQNNLQDKLRMCAVAGSGGWIVLDACGRGTKRYDGSEPYSLNHISKH